MGNHDRTRGGRHSTSSIPYKQLNRQRLLWPAAGATSPIPHLFLPSWAHTVSATWTSVLLSWQCHHGRGRSSLAVGLTLWRVDRTGRTRGRLAGEPVEPEKYLDACISLFETSRVWTQVMCSSSSVEILVRVIPWRLSSIQHGALESDAEHSSIIKCI